LNILKSQICSFGSNKLLACNFTKAFSTSHALKVSFSAPSFRRQETIRFIEDSIKRIGIFDEIDLAPAQLDWDFLLDEKNVDRINANIRNRRAHGDILSLVRQSILTQL
jgi:hypothetical protein